MHNYVDLKYADNFTISTPNDEQEYKGANRIAEDGSKDLMSKIQAQRDAEIQNITKNRPPMSL
jgi:hypothetical protein